MPWVKGASEYVGVGGNLRMTSDEARCNFKQPCLESSGSVSHHRRFGPTCEMLTSWVRVTCDALGTTGKADANAAEDKVCQDGETILTHKVSMRMAVNRKVLSARPVRGAK